MDEALTRAKMAVGGAVGLSRLIGVTSQAISQWKRVPAERVLDVERATGIPRHELRPDIFGDARGALSGGYVPAADGQTRPGESSAIATEPEVAK